MGYKSCILDVFHVLLNNCFVLLVGPVVHNRPDMLIVTDGKTKARD